MKLIFIAAHLLFATFVTAAWLPAQDYHLASEVSTALSVRAGPAKDDLPPSPYQWKIRDTSISLIFGKYTGSIEWLRVMSMLFRAQTAVVQGVIESKGDAYIPAPNMKWSRGYYYVAVNQHLELPWSTLSKALMGIYDFFDAFEPTMCSVTILDDKLGILGEVTLGTDR